MIHRQGGWLGRVSFCASGGQTARFFNECVLQGIVLEKTKATATGFTADVPARQYRRLHKIARKTGCKLRIQQKAGLPFAVHRYRHRWGIVVGATVGLVLLLLFRRVVWKIDFSQFTPLQEIALRTQLYQNGVYEGCLYDAERFASLANHLFVENTTYRWIALNFIQGRLVVEKVDASPTPETQEKNYSDVVARCGGIVRTVVLEDGYQQVERGQAVTAGQVLVAGYKTGETGYPFVTHAAAQVYAEVESTYVCRQPLAVQCVVPTAAAGRYNILHFPYIDIPMHSENNTPLPGSRETVVYTPLRVLDFPLPATVETRAWRVWEQTTFSLEKAQATEIARVRVRDTMGEWLPGYRVLSWYEDVVQEKNTLVLSVRARLYADIATVVPGKSLS